MIFTVLCLKIQRPTSPGVAGNPEVTTGLEDTKSLTTMLFQSPNDCRVVRDLKLIHDDIPFLSKVIKLLWLLAGDCYKTSAKYKLAN